MSTSVMSCFFGGAFFFREMIQYLINNSSVTISWARTGLNSMMLDTLRCVHRSLAQRVHSAPFGMYEWQHALGMVLHVEQRAA